MTVGRKVVEKMCSDVVDATHEVTRHASAEGPRRGAAHPARIAGEATQTPSPLHPLVEGQEPDGRGALVTLCPPYPRFQSIETRFKLPSCCDPLGAEPFSRGPCKCLQR